MTSATYRDPDHPVQLAIVSAVDDLAHEQAQNLAVDGCGAPAYALSLYALARAYGRLAAATDGPEAHGRRGDPRASGASSPGPRGTRAR